MSLLVLLINLCHSKVFHLGVLFPWDGFLPIGSKGGGGGAVSLAIHEINTKKVLFPYMRSGNHSIRFSWADTQCDAKIGLPLIADMYYAGFSSQPVEAFVGPGCSVICEPGGLLVAKWGIPMVSYGSTSSKMSDKSLYPTFARAQAPNSRCAPFFVKIMQRFGYDRIAIFFSTENIWSLTATALRENFLATGIIITQYFTFQRGTAGNEVVRNVLFSSSQDTKGKL